MHDKRLTDSFQDWGVEFHCALKIGFDGSQINFAILGLIDLHMMLIIFSIFARRPVGPTLLCVQVDFNSKLILPVMRCPEYNVS